MISLNNEPCCICGETRSLLVQETTYPEHGYPGSFCLRRCTGCGLLFNSPRLDDRELGQLYGRNYYFFNRADATELARVVPMYARTIALIEPDVPERRALDVGCGRGYLPAVLGSLGWDAHGVEISAEASAYARQRFGLRHVFTGTAEQYAASAEAKQFPLVTAIDVIEHVPAPDAFVAALGRVVEPGGLLIVDTPNAMAYNIRAEGENWKGFNPFHIYLFTIENLRRLLGTHGFVVEQSFSYHNAAADDEHQPLTRRLRNASIDAARTLGVLGPAAKLYFKLKTLSAPRGDVQTHLARAAAAIRNGVNYMNTPDAQDTLARDATGDNIVVIARKAASG